MSAALPFVRFVRQLDLRTWDLGGRLTINPRTRYAEGRAGLSWTGVRDYRTPEGTLRVLRRPEQVRAPGHLRTLRRLPTPPGHPSEDRDVLPRYTDELVAGFTGDEIAWEEVGSWGRPVADLTVIRPEVFGEMMPLEQWRDYCRAYPDDCKGIVRGYGPAKTGTSLGYNALWVSPTVLAEIVDEVEGAPVGSWLGPDGKQYLYDVEHVVDPECELVLRLQRDEGFDPSTLGGQHFAIRLDSMTGRGGEQSELIRVVDSQQITADPRLGRVQVSAPRAKASIDMQWTVAPSRDLPFEEGERAWDGAEAEQSIFDGAGWPDSPDPDAAKLGFLVYDSDSPELKGSYKFPFARRDQDGRLRVPKSGLVAAAQMLPKATTIPAEVRDRMQAVIDHYNERYERAAKSTQDAQEQLKMTQQNVVVGVRDQSVAKFLSERKLKTVTDLNVTLDMLDASKVESKLGEIMERMAELMEMVKMAESQSDEYKSEMDGMKSEMQDMAGKMKDMPSVEELSKKLDDLKGQMRATEEELASAKAAAAKATDAAKATIDELTDKLAKANDELTPVRAKQLADKRGEFVKLGLAKANADACEDLASLERAFAAEHISERYAKQSKDEQGKAIFVKSADAVSEAVEVYLKGRGESKAPAADPTPYTPGAGLGGFPTPRIVKSVADKEDKPNPVPQPTSTSKLLAASCE